MGWREGDKGSDRGYLVAVGGCYFHNVGVPNPGRDGIEFADMMLKVSGYSRQWGDSRGGVVSGRW